MKKLNYAHLQRKRQKFLFILICSLLLYTFPIERTLHYLTIKAVNWARETSQTNNLIDTQFLQWRDGSIFSPLDPFSGIKGILLTHDSIVILIALSILSLNSITELGTVVTRSLLRIWNIWYDFKPYTTIDSKKFALFYMI